MTMVTGKMRRLATELGLKEPIDCEIHNVGEDALKRILADVQTVKNHALAHTDKPVACELMRHVMKRYSIFLREDGLSRLNDSSSTQLIRLINANATNSGFSYDCAEVLHAKTENLAAKQQSLSQAVTEKAATMKANHDEIAAKTAMVDAKVSLVELKIGNTALDDGKRLETLQTGVTNLNQSVDRLDARLGKVETEVASVNARLGKMETEVKSVNARLGKMETEVKSVNARLGKVETEVASMNARLGKMETEVASIDARLGKVETHLAILQVRAEEGNTLSRNLQIRMSAMERNIEKLQENQAEILRRLDNLIVNNQR